MLELVERNFEEFFSVPFRVYRPGSLYVSPMKSDLRRFLSDANPLFQGRGAYTFFTVRRAGLPVGRIVAHMHHASNELHRLRRSYFGYFDCADDSEAARLLLDAAESWARRHHADHIAGNFNLTAMQQMGVVTEGFEHPPYTDLQYNPAHVPRLLEANGYERFFPMTTWEIDLDLADPAAVVGPRERTCLDDPAWEWRPITRRGFSRTMPDILRILNEGFAENPMFVPLSVEEFVFQAKEMMWIVDERIATIVYRDGAPIGVMICIPDLTELFRRTRSRYTLATPVHFLRHLLSRTRAVLIFAGVRPDFQSQGLGGAMLFRTVSALKQAGYHRLGITWISDENPRSLRPVQKFGGRPLHRLHLYRKPVGPS